MEKEEVWALGKCDSKQNKEGKSPDRQENRRQKNEKFLKKSIKKENIIQILEEF